MSQKINPESVAAITPATQGREPGFMVIYLKDGKLPAGGTFGSDLYYGYFCTTPDGRKIQLDYTFVSKQQGEALQSQLPVR